MTHDFHKFWLRITAVVIASFAPIMFLGSMVSTSAPLQFTVDLLGLPLDGLPRYGDPASRFLAAIMGGLLLGWGATIWCLQAWVYDAAPDGVRRSVVTALCLWFALDSAGSILSGHASNVLFNIGILLMAVGPMWRPAQVTA
ncbi:hypothetical protein [uncultured Tateyamaria sp.]|uniref:hypothetical protein n=1 Tax=uncultured Tateyamaria sp. TaxID=455651 RepID=UPI00261DA42E|nr:hypothetical protein [uncultured Tateyamaria sp.]